MFKKLDHLALHVADVAAAKAFYVDTFGFEVVEEHIGTAGFAIAYVKLGNSLIELTTRPGGEAMSGFHICLVPENFAAACAQLMARGLPVVVAPRPTTPRGAEDVGAQRAVFKGPHGELIEVKGH